MDATGVEDESHAHVHPLSLHGLELSLYRPLPAFLPPNENEILWLNPDYGPRLAFGAVSSIENPQVRTSMSGTICEFIDLGISCNISY